MTSDKRTRDTKHSASWQIKQGPLQIKQATLQTKGNQCALLKFHLQSRLLCLSLKGLFEKLPLALGFFSKIIGEFTVLYMDFCASSYSRLFCTELRFFKSAAVFILSTAHCG
jgi:hypothetical protein